MKIVNRMVMFGVVISVLGAIGGCATMEKITKIDPNKVLPNSGRSSELKPLIDDVTASHAVLTAGSVALSQSRISLVAAVGRKKDAADLQAELDAAVAIPDTKEKDVQVRKVEERIKINGDEAIVEAQNMKEKASAESLKSLGASLESLVQAVVADVAAVKTVQKVASTGPVALERVKSNPVQAVLEAKYIGPFANLLAHDVPDMVRQIPGQAKEMYGFLDQARKFLRSQEAPVPKIVEDASEPVFGA
ncbi:MAG: hypothetical protein IPG61_08250 [bacterium]|nr:hypothetical protein [bacterium]